MAGGLMPALACDGRGEFMNGRVGRYGYRVGYVVPRVRG
jgi:hypothetical protein